MHNIYENFLFCLVFLFLQNANLVLFLIFGPALHHGVDFIICCFLWRLLRVCLHVWFQYVSVFPDVLTAGFGRHCGMTVENNTVFVCCYCLL